MRKFFFIPALLFLLFLPAFADNNSSCDSVIKDLLISQTEKKELEIQLLTKERETQEAILKSQRVHTSSVVLGIVSIVLLFACIGLLILAVYYKRKL